MRMIPPTPNAKCTGTERQVFERLSAAFLGQPGTCISSLNLSEHQYKRWAEIDFLTIRPEGLVVVEVKGGVPSCVEGKWSYTSAKSGQVVTRNESPIEQAKTAFFEIERLIKDRLGKHLWTKAPTGFCIIFAGIYRSEIKANIGSPEWPADIIGTKDDLTSREAIERLILRVESYWRKKCALDASQSWTAAEAKQIAQLLRPDFIPHRPLALTIADVADEQLTLTDEQFRILYRLYDSDRVLCDGPAGCGKTFLAIEAMRQEKEDLRSTLLVTGSDHLADHLRTTFPELSAEIVAFKTLAESSYNRPPADTLIVDEGQQLCRNESLAILDKVVVGGLEHGRWRWFCDSENQVARDSGFDRDCYDSLRHYSTSSPTLLINCRNTPDVVNFIELATHARLGEARTTGAGGRVELIPLSDDALPTAAVGDEVRRLLQAGIEPRNIAILNAHSLAEDEEFLLSDACGTTIRPWKLARRGAGIGNSIIAISTVSDFRGLESPFIIIYGLGEADADQEIQKILYLGISRANIEATIIAPKGICRKIQKFMQDKLKRHQELTIRKSRAKR